MKLEERTLPSKLRYWAENGRDYPTPSDVLLAAAAALDQLEGQKGTLLSAGKRMIANLEDKVRELEAERDAALQRIAGALSLALPLNGDHVQAIELDIRRLLDVEKRWLDACELARAHCPVGNGESHVRQGIPRLAARVHELEAELEQRAATAEDFLRELEAARLEAFRSKRELDDCRGEWRKQERAMLESSERQGAEIGRLTLLVADGAASAAKLDEVLAGFPRCYYCEAPGREWDGYTAFCGAHAKGAPLRAVPWLHALEAVEKLRAALSASKERDGND